MSMNTNAVHVRISAEEVYMQRAWADPRYGRKVEAVITTEPTEADWAEYRKAKEAHDYLLESPYFQDGGPDEGSSVSEPEPKPEYIYAETTKEWLDRCWNLDEEAA